MHTLKELQNRIGEAFGDTRFIHQPTHLYEPIAYTLDQGGKRLRPVLVLLSCELFGGDIEEAVFPSMGLEIFHNFTLLHDDIMDHAPLRRGKETVHQKWDVNTAILSGDTMFVLAYEFVAKTNPKLLPQVLDLFNYTARKVCEGQQYDMNFETQTEVSIDDYMMMIRLKTAVLIACSMKLGAIIAGADTFSADKIYAAGIELGLAFQLQDDFLDAFGDISKFGKTIGGDIATNKKTYLFLKSHQLADAQTRQNLTDLFLGPGTDSDKKISGIIEIYKQLHIDEITRMEIEKHHKNALEILASLNFGKNSKGELLSLMDEMLCRER